MLEYWMQSNESTNKQANKETSPCMTETCRTKRSLHYTNELTLKRTVLWLWLIKSFHCLNNLIRFESTTDDHNGALSMVDHLCHKSLFSPNHRYWLIGARMKCACTWPWCQNTSNLVHYEQNELHKCLLLFEDYTRVASLLRWDNCLLSEVGDGELSMVN